MRYSKLSWAGVAMVLALGCSGDTTSNDGDEVAMSEDDAQNAADVDRTQRDDDSSAADDSTNSNDDGSATSSETTDDDASNMTSNASTSAADDPSDTNDSDTNDGEGRDSEGDTRGDGSEDGNPADADGDSNASSDSNGDVQTSDDDAADDSGDELAAPDDNASQTSSDDMSADPTAGEELSSFGFVPLTESPGSVRLELNIEGAFCDTTECGFGRRHIVIRTAEDGPVLVGVGSYAGCPPTPCDTCQEQPCPGFSCLEPEGYQLDDEAFAWDGSFVEQSTCGDNMACTQTRYAPAGRYFAQMCAMPGTVVDGMCAGEPPVECVSVEFDFPGDTFAGEITAP